ncbi:T9SS type A sorting domain-containing protein [Fulvivirga sp. M361]|uniref:reprolysin-like metallopeptidase n=1 Tax=Fulvivirga sp. M361 TaxID=2594266 RepID=UPI00117B5F7D|nr:zinc-dependent metalloprotease family protein [Fulvivirga sp. M361]TRX51738.1 T9SS type A sorting domain-containing protein [Fulvivirga sp. M361]
MKRIVIVFTIFFAFLISQKLEAQSNLWQEQRTNARVSDQWSAIKANRKTLNKEALSFVLSELKSKGATNISIPHPSGGEQMFEVVPSNVMAPGLQAKYPNIQTFKGVNTQGELVRGNVGANGLNLAVFSRHETYLVKPQSKAGNRYVSYFEKDYLSTFDSEEPHFFCEHEEHFSSDAIQIPSSDRTPRARQMEADFTPFSTGEVLRKYRIAIVAYHEYSEYIGGTREEVLSNIVSLLDVVIGIFERDASITFELVENNDQLIFLTEEEDPTPTSGSTFIEASHNVITDIIGSENFDIGHLLAIGVGGKATVLSICRDDVKGQGVSFQRDNGREGDLSFVLPHELGHQFGTNHSSARGALERDTRFEFALGQTIMKPSAPTPVPYFHVGSIIEIIDGAERTGCAELIETGNTPPVVSVPEGGFVIPVNTPFVLEAEGNDADGDPLTYSWEQYDQSTNPDEVVPGHSFAPWEGDGPLFKSFEPTTDNRRFFPQLNSVLDNTLLSVPNGDLPILVNQIGSSSDFSRNEVIPHKTRDLNFVVTVRDNSPLGPGIATDIISFSSTDQAGPFVVTTVLDDPSYNGFSNVNVQWEVANTNAAPVNCENVTILYATDGGKQFDIVLAESTANDGEATVKLPNIATSEARIMVKAVNNVFFNVNDRNFTVIASEVDVPEAPTNLAGNRVNPFSIELSWTDNGDLEDGFVIERKSGSDNFEEIARTPVNNTSYTDQTAQDNESYSYRVAAFNATGNSGYTNEVSFVSGETILSVNDHQPPAPDILLFPNPVTSGLRVITPKESKNYLTDFSGKVLVGEKRGEEVVLDLEDLASGIYLLISESADGITYKRVIKI